MKEKRKYHPITFISQVLGKSTTLTIQQQVALKGMQNRNSHTEVRIRLSMLFHAPKEILDVFTSIKRLQDKDGSLLYGDYIRRMEATSKLNEFILDNFGGLALDKALMYQ